MEAVMKLQVRATAPSRLWQKRAALQELSVGGATVSPARAGRFAQETDARAPSA
jgi:hypothetical protein